ncbi:MAG: NAD-dependent epimerase/dehydratase family protein [Lacipirellulaceae bacterium]
MSSLVTGATGFIGARLVERLRAAGEEVVCLVRDPARAKGVTGPGVRLALGSLDDEASLAAAIDGIDTVYHLAGKTHGVTLAEFVAVNAGGTERVCRAAVACATPPTVVVVSSLSAAGPSPPDKPHTEHSPPAPISRYGRSKLLAEEAAQGYADRAPISIVRPPVVFGPGDRDGLLLFKALRRFPLHFVPQLRGLPLSLVYVDDLVEGLVAAAQKGERCDPSGADPSRGVYYVADPTPSSYAEMGRLAAGAMGRRAWVLCRRKYPLVVPALVGDLAAKFRGKASVMNSDKLREASANGWVCDPSKAFAQLGLTPPRPLAERYAETARWYEAAGWLAPPRTA